MSRSSYSSKNIRAAVGALAVGASETNLEIGPEFAIRSNFMKAFIIDIEASALTAGAGITAKLQVRQSNTQAWIDSKTVAMTATGTSTIKLLADVAADQTFLPLRPVGRIVVTTGAGSSLTISAIYVLES